MLGYDIGLMEKKMETTMMGLYEDMDYKDSSRVSEKWRSLQVTTQVKQLSPSKPGDASKSSGSQK